MGKAKYKKHNSSTCESKIEKKQPFVSKSSSKKKKKKEKKVVTLSSRLLERRLAITPAEIRQAKLYMPKRSLEDWEKALGMKKMPNAFSNMDSLMDALPAIEKKSRNRSVKEKPRLSKSLKTREIEMIKDIQWYHGAIQDPSFQADPWKALAEHIHHRQMNEQKESS